MKLYVFFLSICLAFIFSISSKAYDSIEFHCDKDTTLINSLLSYPELKEMAPENRVAFFARKLVGSRSGLRQQILEADTMVYTIDVHSFTPLSFISTCLALAKAYETSSAPNWRDFADKYENVMFKRGEATDFVSRFLYPSDWIADNIFRGNVTDVTFNLDGLAARKKEKSIDYISHNKDSFKAFNNPTNYERLKMLEMGFRNHQIPYISNGDLMNSKRFKPQAKEGDIFFLLTPDFNLDSREMGILTFDGDNLLIVQLSPSKDTVTLEELPFENYVKRNVKRTQGARIIRISK
ncbi:MAG: DUF1460 domain-containing protein [Muribaculaceae bacterium]|nr:DUF1460 domain-containing protein [Muribaculaceae bacterium]MDE6633158.1 DUF1460 domain-containing protein [Muribaculaceae bacterium]